MADVVITFKIMPDSPEEDLKVIEEKAIKMIAEFGGEVGKVIQDPVGFGLVALKLIFVMNEDIGGTDALEAQIAELKEVANVDVTDVRRAIG
jgi:elongation factor 1-beta